MQIVVVEPQPGGKLADMIRDGLRALGQNIGVLPVEPRICADSRLPEETLMAFVCVNSMREVEVARQLAHFHRDIPLVFVSASPEYGMEGFRLEAADYLLEPLCPDDVAAALSRGLLKRKWYSEACCN